MLQDRVFVCAEADRWFARNRTALHDFDAELDLPLRLIGLYQLRPRHVLEVGAANGVRLAALNRRTGATAVAVEPSAEAVVDGRRHYPAVKFVRGTAAAVPLKANFDLVIVNFVFHWIDRASLLQSVAEVDRLVQDCGYLLIGDFYPSNHYRVRYHHRPDEKLYTYKQNYAAAFLASGLYHPVALLTADHASKALSAETPESERIGSWLLRKESRAHYIESNIL